jgi:endonuclease III
VPDGRQVSGPMAYHHDAMRHRVVACSLGLGIFEYLKDFLIMSKFNFTPTQLVKLLTKAYLNKQGVFLKRVNAEDHIPNNATDKQKSLFLFYIIQLDYATKSQQLTDKQKSLFLFYIIQLDYATKSQQLYVNAKKLWESDRNFFNPEFILNLKSSNLKSILKKHLNPRYINEAVKRWKLNSQTLLDKYKGNPLNIFKASNDATEIEKLVREFRGFGPKIGNFFFRSMVNTFHFKPNNLEQIYQPVDIHDVRLTYEWGFVKSKKMTQSNIKKVQGIWQKACQKAKISWLVFDKALWLLGSEGVRSNDPNSDLIINLKLKNKDVLAV